MTIILYPKKNEFSRELSTISLAIDCEDMYNTLHKCINLGGNTGMRTIKPTHKPIKTFYAELKQYESLGATNETEIRLAFATLLVLHAFFSDAYPTPLRGIAFLCSYFLIINFFYGIIVEMDDLNIIDLKEQTFPENT